MEGAIVDIRRFTVHDGPGIRSTAFLKGCALRCAWCQNPEAILPGIELWYLPGTCIHCRACVAACPAGALASGEEPGRPFIRVDRAACDRCGACVAACPTTALSFDGRRLAAEEVARALLRDREFYRLSGGGVTLSGGDPLFQPDFALEILGRCRDEGVHTAIETALFADWGTVERFLPLVDLFIVDLKLADPAEHLRYTGRPNEAIRRNYAGLARAAKELLTRIPLIPGASAAASKVSALARFIRETNPGARVELMNFNPLAVGKYLQMGRDTSFFEGMASLSEAELEALRALLEAEGLRAVRERRRRARGGEGS